MPLSREDMEQVIKEGGSVLLPGPRPRVVTKLEHLPGADVLAQQGLADPREALAELQRQQAEIQARMQALMSSNVLGPRPEPAPASPLAEGVVKHQGPVKQPESVANPKAEGDPLEAESSPPAKPEEHSRWGKKGS